MAMVSIPMTEPSSANLEQLLGLQEQQHALRIEEKDAEIAHLLARLAASEAQVPPEEAVLAVLQSKDEECALMMAAKHKELEFLASLLEMREHQIEDLQQQVLPSRSDGAVSPYLLGNHPADEPPPEIARELQRLRLRMEDLEAAVTEQQEKCNGLAESLERKAQQVEFLEEQIRSLKGDTWEEKHLNSHHSENHERQTPSRVELYPSPSPSPASAESYCSAIRRDVELDAPAVVSTGRQSQELLREMRRLRQQMNELERIASGRGDLDGSHGAAIFGTPGGSPELEPQTSVTSLKRSVKHTPDSLSGWEYRAKPDDPIDAAVAQLVNSRYRPWRALLCRLEQGIYLCGTRRVRIRVDEACSRLEASEDGETWGDLTQIMTGFGL